MFNLGIVLAQLPSTRGFLIEVNSSNGSNGLEDIKSNIAYSKYRLETFGLKDYHNGHDFLHVQDFVFIETKQDHTQSLTSDFQ